MYTLSRRVEQLEADLARTAGQLASPESDALSIKHQTELARTESPVENVSGAVPHPQLGRNWYFRGMQLLSREGQQWIESKTGQTAPLDHAFDGDRHAPRAFPLPGKLPDKHSTHEIIDAFFKSSANLYSAVLDRTLIDTTVEEAYSRQSLPAQACVWALHTWRCLPFTAQADVEAAAQCQALLERINWESSLEALQAILLLVSDAPWYTAALTITASWPVSG